MNGNNEEDNLNQLRLGIKASAELAHMFYVSMIASGAGVTEATAGMEAFISIWYTSLLNNGKKRNEKGL